MSSGFCLHPTTWEDGKHAQIVLEYPVMCYSLGPDDNLLALANKARTPLRSIAAMQMLRQSD